MINDHCIGDDRIDRSLSLRILGLTHPVADDFATAEFYFLTVDGEIFLHLNDQVGVGQPHAVAGGWAKHVGIGSTGDAGH